MPLPTATVGVDTNHDGHANFVYTGVDLNHDGIPDALQEPGFFPLPLEKHTIPPEHVVRYLEPVPSHNVLHYAEPIPSDHALRYTEQVEFDFMGKLEKISPGYILAVVGTVLLMLLVLTSVWDSARLLHSSAHVYFLGRAWCFWTICFCCGIVLFYLFAMLLMERCGRQQAKTVPSYMYLFSTTITMLGLGMLLLARPLHMDVSTAYDELMQKCNTGLHTKQLAVYYNALLNMRLQPNCLNKVSVEQCSGFQDHYPYTAFLKQMEFEYLCSGFCYQAVAQMPNGSKPSGAVLLQHVETKEERTNDYVGLLQHDRLTVLRDDGGEAFSILQITRDTFQHGETRNNRAGLQPSQKHVAMQGLFMLAASRNMSNSSAVRNSSSPSFGGTKQNTVAPGWWNAYPPTLFTNANYKTTCEGAAARELLFSAGETSNLMYMEGTGLLIFSLIVAILKLCSMCVGNVQFEHSMVPHPDGQHSKGVVL